MGSSEKLEDSKCAQHQTADTHHRIDENEVPWTYTQKPVEQSKYYIDPLTRKGKIPKLETICKQLALQCLLFEKQIC